MKYYLSVYCSLLCLLMVACNTKTEKKSQTVNIQAVDILHPSQIYNQLKDASTATIDSTYNLIFNQLADSSRYDLLEQHIFCYRRLAGNRLFAQAQIAKNTGWIQNFKTLYDSSDYNYDKAIDLYSKTGNRSGEIAACYSGKALNNSQTGNFDENARNNIKALTIYEQLHDSNNIYYVKTEMANTWLNQREPDKALITLQECLNYYLHHPDKKVLAYTYSLLSKVYFEKKDYRQTLTNAQEAMTLRRQIGDIRGVSSCLNNIAAAYGGMKQYDKALEGFQSALAIRIELKDERQLASIRQNIAGCLWQLGKTQEADAILLASIDSAKQKKELQVLATAYLMLAKHNKENQHFAAALDFYEQFKTIDDSLHSLQKEKLVNELVIKYEARKKEARIIQLNSEHKADTAKKVLYLSLLMFAIAIGMLTVLWLINNNKKNKLALELAQIELKNNEQALKQFTESIISKNRLIDELETKLSDNEKNTALAEEIDENNECLSQLYQLKILTEDDWREFKILFDKVHPGLISRLRNRFPDLSPAEERQFLLIRLNIDNKESADMLGISIPGVKKNRYRLKKRFGLGEEDNLDDFVKQI